MTDAAVQAIVDRIKDDYIDVRILPDGSIAGIGRLMYTTAIYLGMHEHGFERRFCFKDGVRAIAEYSKLRTEDDEPTGWIARRPEQPCDREHRN